MVNFFLFFFSSEIIVPFCIVVAMLDPVHHVETIFEPRREKTGLWGFRPGPTQTRLYGHRR